MKKFKTSKYGTEIEPVEVVRETDAFVIFPPYRPGGKERRTAKCTDYERYHDTWEDARAFLLSRAEQDVQSARRRLEVANGTLGNVKGMKKPVDA